MPRTISFDELDNADLTVEAIYLGGVQKNMGDDPLARLLPVGNQGGFRYRGSPKKKSVQLVVLYTSGAEIDWPDNLDPQTAIFTYYGDNREPGRDLHDTARDGNLLLRNVFEASHGNASDRAAVPPFFLFERASPGRAVRFRGLLAPGSATLSADDDLNAVWRNKHGLRFQNYRAKFCVLDAPNVSRQWINDLCAGVPPAESHHCPLAWREWAHGRVYNALTAPSTAIIRNPTEQAPGDQLGRDILAAIHSHFQNNPSEFEKCAVDIWRLIAPSTGAVDVTRPSRDGGRDAVGEYVLGPKADPVKIDFALEAKCYAPTTVVGVRDVSRLISRLRHRNFGVFVTLSHFNVQVYDEVRQDGHPIALVCGRDIVEALRDKGYGDVAAVKAWLEASFPVTPAV